MNTTIDPRPEPGRRYRPKTSQIPARGIAQRIVDRLSSIVYGLSTITAISPGKEDDGLHRISPLPYDIEKQPDQLAQEFTDALDAWRTNPLARRIVTLTTAYVCGDGITLSSPYPTLQRFLDWFWTHPQNDMPTRQRDLCDELTRTGELFLVLHTNPADGMSYVRAISAGAIDSIETAPGDYETEISYHETVPIIDPDYKDGGRTWLSPQAVDSEQYAVNSTDRSPSTVHRSSRTPGTGLRDPGPFTVPPVMLHFAVNRPVGAVRGESDLAPILNWLRRYNRWLEDRVRLNAAVRAFLWIVRVPARMVDAKATAYRHPPEAGNVIVTEQGAEEWEAVTPKLEARDAAPDGRAIRWMIAAGGPGTSLVDFGEGEDANLATAKAMSEQRQKVMRGRQHLFAHILQTIVITAYNRARQLGRLRGRECTTDDLNVSLPDISPTDNADLASAAFNIANAFRTLSDAGAGAGPTYTQIALRLLLRFAGETITEEDLAAIVRETQEAGIRGLGERQSDNPAAPHAGRETPIQGRIP